MKTHVSLLMVLLFLIGCNDSDVEKHFNAKDNVIDVRDKLQPIDFGEVYMSLWAKPDILNDYLIITDTRNPDEIIHIFDKNTFKYITSTGQKGQGPNDLANFLGEIMPIEEKNSFLVIDHGHQWVFNFPMDSIVNNPNFLPKKQSDIDPDNSPMNMVYANDTLAYGRFWHIVNYHSYTTFIGKYNLQNGTYIPFDKGERPYVKEDRINFDASLEHNIYVESYWWHELIIISDLEGNLKHVLKGSQFNSEFQGKGFFEEDIEICGDKIILTYLGIRSWENRSKLNRPTKLIVFDIEGNYITTLETGLALHEFTYDEENNRLILVANDEMQFSYLDLEGII